MRFALYAASLAAGISFLAGQAHADGTPMLRHIPVQPASQPADNSSGCPSNRQSGGLCFSATRFESYLAASADCASGGGRLPTLGELFAFRAGPGKSETGIDCSSTFDMGSGTLWCVGDGGAISGKSLNPQLDPLEKLSAPFRCVTYLKS